LYHLLAEEIFFPNLILILVAKKYGLLLFFLFLPIPTFRFPNINANI